MGSVRKFYISNVTQRRIFNEILQYYAGSKTVKNLSGKKIYFTYKGKKLTLAPGKKISL